MINAGELTARISIERDTITRESGVEKKTPATLFTVWAKPESISGRERWRNQEMNAEVDWRFTMRYAIASPVKASDRVVMGTKRYEVKAVIPDEINRDSVVLLCKSLNA